MIVTSTGIINGVIQDQYGGRGTQFKENGVPTYSLPIKIENAPVGTLSFALVLEDKDAYPDTELDKCSRKPTEQRAIFFLRWNDAAR